MAIVKGMNVVISYWVCVSRTVAVWLPKKQSCVSRTVHEPACTTQVPAAKPNVVSDSIPAIAMSGNT